MKFSCVTAAVALSSMFSSALAFVPGTPAFARPSLDLSMKGNFDLSGNTWKPDSEKMGSTDTGDYFPEGYNPEIGFEEGMMGSQAFGQGNRDGPDLPGMENLGEDAVMMGGIETASEIPAGMEFVASSVPDGEFSMSVAASSSGGELVISAAPVCMTFEDFYAAFSADSPGVFSVEPAAGRMDRRGGEPTEFKVFCNPAGQPGDYVGNLVINLPEDNSKICYKITASCF